ncbi:amino acid adenylation domain-containing protein [Chitinophaga polysaccharea]|uniref:non-ribosomal peptide synthetase n=1 Tax=Chitinophaga polysaccharea TaxID=1293035 RepID=UPI0014552AA0|nr:non-ribosomal peptide synthetase [Chitinophaga polysaccharea]NLR57660.1 amino acid adenylation domain-containing protein [Chitinophaga polysaccharea]
MSETVNTLIDLLEARKTDMRGVSFIKNNSDKEHISYAALYDKAIRLLFYLQKKGLKPHDEVILQIEEPSSFLITYWACILGGIIPVPLAVGKTYDQYLKLFNVWDCLNSPSLVTTSGTLEKLKAGFPSVTVKVSLEDMADKILLLEESSQAQGTGKIFAANKDTIAYVQFSSGSTSTPKGVTLTHKNILTNCRAILGHIDSPESGDTFFSWMPLTHDMGLIGYHLTPMVAGWEHYIMPTELFIRRPALWLEVISRFRITFTASPNFGYAYILNYLDNYELQHVDLSCLRIITNGAEPISASLCDAFTRRMAHYGLSACTIFPVYGLAEACLAVTFSRPGAGVKAITINRESLGVGSKVEVLSTHNNGVTFVNVGRPLSDNCNILITDNDRQRVEPGTIGHILIKGDNVTSHYYNNEAATVATVSPEGWLDTGDLGFTLDGDLYITGREKDLILVNAQNFYPHDLELQAQGHPKVRAGKIAVAGYYNPQKDKEEVLVFVQHRGTVTDFLALYTGLAQIINERAGVVPEYIIPVKEIPKTTSGKIQRYRLIEQYAAGAFDQVLEDMAQSIGSAGEKEKTADSNTITTLTEIWEEVLERRGLNAGDHFFSIGGNSMLAARLLMRIQASMGVDLSVGDLYTYPEIGRLAEYIDQAYAGAIPAPVTHFPFDAVYPLSSTQERLYYIWQSNPNSIAYNIPSALCWDGEMDTVALEKSMRQMLDRHQLLRGFFGLKYRAPALFIAETVDVEIIYEYLVEEDLNGALVDAVQAFDLHKGPLFRIKVFRVSAKRCILFADFHHIIADGISIAFFLEELMSLYVGKVLSPPAFSYMDYLGWQKSNSSSEEMTQHQSFWKNHLQGELPILSLPLDKARPPVFDHAGEKRAFYLDTELKEQLQVVAKERGVSLFTICLAAWYITLAKYTGQEDIVTGVPVSGRSRAAWQGVFGMFVNSLALRAAPEGSKTLAAFLSSLADMSQEAIARQDYPFSEMVALAGMRREMSRNQLFDTMFIYQQLEVPVPGTDNIHLSRYFFDPGVAKYDMSLEIFEAEDKFYIEYATSLFEPATIDNFAKHYQNVLRYVATSIDTTIAQVNMLSPEELRAHTVTFNAAVAAYPRHTPIHQLISEAIARNPGYIAVAEGRLTWSGGELEARAVRLAAFLERVQPGSNEPVGIILERGAGLIVAILAVLKSGRAFVPVDPVLPSARIKYVLENCGAAVVITNAENIVRQHDLGLPQAIFVNVDDYPVLADIDLPVEKDISPESIAYIIYTSGTSGNPKGVMVTHRSLVNYAWWGAKIYAATMPADFPLFTSISFDLTITSIFVPLLTSNTIVVYKDTGSKLSIEQVLEDNRIDVIKLTPSHLKMMAADPSLISKGNATRIRKIIVGGEALTTSLAAAINNTLGGNVDIYNEYGPTEATVGCMIYRYQPEKDNGVNIPIGRPMDNAAIYLLDRYLNPVPYGVTGEIYIAGDCLAAGYWHDPILTEQRFIDDPFCPGRKMYKTGDLARKLSSGEIDFQGRVDNQAKINGHRVEPAEIEQYIKMVADVKDVVVLTRKDKDGAAFLCAYVVMDKKNTSEELFLKSLQTHLYLHLPVYLIPAKFVIIDAIPLTRNGKVDQERLPLPSAERRTRHVAPRTAMEERIAAAWEKVFRISGAGVEDNFFELGGDSIKAVQIAGYLREENISLSTRSILTYPTISQLSLQASFTDTAAINQGTAEGFKAKTPVEHWFFRQQFKNPHYFNQSIVLKFKRRVDNTLLDKAFGKIIEHHDALRLNYDEKDNRPFFNNDYLRKPFKIDTCTLSATETIAAKGRSVKSSFNIHDTLLIKPLIIYQGNSMLLLITAHHLVVDGISWRILLEDLYRLYTTLENGQPPLLSRKTGSCQDWPQLLERYALQENIVERTSEFWQTMSSTVFKMPMISGRATGLSRTGKTVAHLDERLTEFMLKEAHLIYNTDTLMLLTTALAIVLKDWCNTPDVKIEMEHHGRNLPGEDVAKTIGWFTAMYPVSLHLETGDIGMQLRYVKELLNNIPQQGIGYGILKDLYGKFSDQHQEAPVRLNYLGQFDQDTDNDLFSYEDIFSGEDIDPENAPTACIEINAIVIYGRLKVEITYDSHYFTAHAATNFIEQYIAVLEEIIQHLLMAPGRYFTASDFDTSELDEDDLKALFSQI